ncbi:MAG: SEC-C domain-containing protein, partial [Candidatus Dormibacteraeota bacterium]|nr:SEC-C domain-containing protein [Candidatus Dormibacteraeota bacterium]
VIEKGVEGHCEGRHAEMWDLDGLLGYLGHYFPIPPDTEVPAEALRGGREGLIEYLHQAAVQAYEAKEEQLGAEEVRRQVERFVMLRTIDMKWVDYLTTMEHFREGIGLEAYAQRDPLIEYKNQAFEMFNDLKDSIQADVVANMFRVQLMPQEEPPQPPSQLDRAVTSGDGGDQAAGTRPRGAPGGARGRGAPGNGQPAAAAGNGAGASPAKIGRNDPCWCGSGRKYKRCHGR